MELLFLCCTHVVGSGESCYGIQYVVARSAMGLARAASINDHCIVCSVIGANDHCIVCSVIGANDHCIVCSVIGANADAGEIIDADANGIVHKSVYRFFQAAERVRRPCSRRL